MCSVYGCTVNTESNSRGSLILWAKGFAVSERSNLLWAKNESLTQADLYLVASSPFRIGLRLPSKTSLSCSFSPGVLTVLVFVLHPCSLMMSGAYLKSGSNFQAMSRWIQYMIRTISFLIQAPRKTNDREEIYEHNPQLSVNCVHIFLGFFFFHPMQCHCTLISCFQSA